VTAGCRRAFLLFACSYKHLHGKFVVHPVSQRRIPIIADAELVDMEFGTGAAAAVSCGITQLPFEPATLSLQSDLCLNIKASRQGSTLQQHLPASVLGSYLLPVAAFL
jgi:hypothetical protein